MSSSTGDAHDDNNGLTRNEQLLLALFRRMSAADQVHLVRFAQAFADAVSGEVE